jgi:hypothetical protein
MISLDFKKLMGARFLFTFGVQMQAIVLGWQMYILTHDPLFLGFIGLAEAVPALGLAMYAGYIVDRGRPLVIYRRIIRISFVSAVVMLVSQRSDINLPAHMRIILLFCSSFLTGTARAFSQPCIFSIVPRITKREFLPKASAWMSSAMQVARISGPALGGILFGVVGIGGAALFVCLVLIGGMIFASTVNVNLLPLPDTKIHKSRKDELLSGAKFVLGHPILLPALTLDMVSVFFGGVSSLLPVFAAQILMIGPTGLGLLRGAPAAGAAITSFWLTSFEIKQKAGKYLLIVVAGYGFSILVFALSRNYALSLMALFSSGAFDSVSMVIRSSAVQLASPEALRGKISAVNSIFIGSSNELGEFESGIAAKLIGTVPAAVFGAAVCLVTVSVVAVFSSRLRKLNLDELKLS